MATGFDGCHWRQHDTLGQVRCKILRHNPASAHVRKGVKLTVHMHTDDVEVVTALGIGNATQQRHHERTAGRQFVGGVGDAAVVNTTSKDLVLEEVPVFFRDVADGDELFVQQDRPSAVHR